MSPRTSGQINGKQPTAGRGGRIVFVDIGRGIGALLVVYSHITVLWGTWEHHISLPILNMIDSVTRYPLGLTEQGIGQIAVPFFFLVSGFVVTPIALHDGHTRFFIKRVTRVYPTMAVAVGIAALMFVLGQHPLHNSGLPVVNMSTVLANIAMTNYFTVPQNVMVLAAWTLVVEVLYYLLLLLIMPLLRRVTWYAICVELTVVALIVIMNRAFGPNFFLFAVSVSFLPIILIGQIIWAAHARRIPVWAAVVFTVLAWAIFVTADMLHMGRINDSYDLALGYALLLFCAGLLAEPKLRTLRWAAYLSERSYSIYLLHGVILFPFLDQLSRFMPVLVALPVGLLATLAVVEVTYRLVEHPSHRLGSLLARKIPRRRPHVVETPVVPVIEVPVPSDNEQTVSIAAVESFPRAG
ncbi:MAG TPA: acyltransferase [Pseudonocardiaceae bacterium]